MAFDRNDPVDLAALKSEESVDPISMGYASANNTNTTLNLFNDPDNNVGGESASRVFDASALLDALEPTEFEAQQTSGNAAEYSAMLIGFGDITSYKVRWRGMFAANSDTVVALDAQTSPLSRCEVLFGQGTVISKADWFAARDS